MAPVSVVRDFSEIRHWLKHKPASLNNLTYNFVTSVTDISLFSLDPSFQWSYKTDVFA
jgi:hypothetical protein